MLNWDEIDHVPGWMGTAECKWLSAIAKMVDSWTEVGVYCGRSALAVGQSLPTDALFQLVDIQFEKGFSETLEILKKRRPDIVFVVCEKPSVEAAKQLSDTDVVFIDANHHYEYVREDIVAWKQKCRILCGHDYQPNWAGVMRAVDELCPGAENPEGDIWSWIRR